MQHTTAIPVTESSRVGEARRVAGALAERLGFDETRRGEVAIIVTEAATNLALHAQQGEILLRPLERSGRCGLEILAVDQGPGMANVARFLQDGYSTAGTAGNGLGAMSRLASRFDIHSQLEIGTVLMVQVWAGPPAKLLEAEPLEIGGVCLPKPGQEISGDAWEFLHQPERSLFVVADGLGHGPDAALASQEAIRLMHRHAARTPVEILEAMHQGMHATRGAAIAVAEIDYAANELRYAGVGNIAGEVHEGGNARGMVSYNGIVGHQMRKAQSFVYPFPPGALLLMHSDGLGTRWQIEKYAGLAQRHPALLAGRLYADFRRGTDDVTMVAARRPRLEEARL